MKILKDSTTLLDIERMIEEELLSKDNNNIRIISDMNLTYEEYKYLKLKIKGLGLYRDNIEVWNRYRLSTLLYWVFSLRYEEKELKSHTYGVFDGMHQYALRYLIEMYNDTFEEFGIGVPGITVNSMEGLCESIAVHAGIPDELHGKLYAVLDGNIHAETKVVEKDVIKKLSPKMKTIINHIGKDLQRKMVSQYMKVVYELKVLGLPKEEVLRRNPVASKKVVNSFDKLNKDEDIIAI